VKYLENIWTYGHREVFRAEKLYTPQNYRSFLDSFKANFPEYVYYCPFRGKEILSSPLTSIRDIYVPRDCLEHVLGLENKDPLQKNAMNLVELLSQESMVPLKDFGLHGSIALNMHTLKSDIDLVVYGGRNFRKLEATIGELAENGTLHYVFKNRIDKARRYKGRFKGKLFMFNAVRNSEEIKSHYGEFQYAPSRKVTFECKVKDDSEAMFRPAVYKIKDYDPHDRSSELRNDLVPTIVVSMIGCYRNVARKDDPIRVSGMLEQVQHTKTKKTFHQVVVGTGSSEEEYLWPL
jgi:predicted nucleotidyltransferase